jgi:hypothetical protein
MIETRGAGPLSRTSGLVPSSTRATPDERVRRSCAVGTQTLRRLWRSRGGRPRSPDADLVHQVAALEARLEHLESELQGLQDAVHRQAVLEAEHIDELRARTAPAQLARDLSEDARRRGL